MRSVLVLRLVVWVGLLLTLGVLAVMHANDRPRPDTPAQIGGLTAEGLPVDIVVRDGRVLTVVMRWRMTCERDRTPPVSTINFGESWGDRFAYDGRRFSFTGWDDQTVRPGYVTRYDVTIAGEVSADGRTVSGHGHTIETWLQRGRAVDICRSKDVRFRVSR